VCIAIQVVFDGITIRFLSVAIEMRLVAAYDDIA